MSGSARRLVNLEVSAEGGYSSIQGYVKHDTNPVPPFGRPFVLGADQTGTTLVITNTSLGILVGSTFQVNGAGQVYTVSATTFNPTARTNTLTITPELATTPADKAPIVFTSTQGPRIEGVAINTTGEVIVKRGGALWESGGSGWTYLSAPYYGTVLVSNGSHTSTSLELKDIVVGQIQIGDCFTVAGFDKTFTVTAVTPLVSGVCTVTFTPAISSTPSTDTAVTFVGAGLKHGTGKIKNIIYRFTDECKVGIVDGVNKPFSIGCSTKRFQWVTNAPSDTEGATAIAHLRNSIFFGKGSFLTFAAPSTDNDFNTGNGAGVINVGSSINSLVPFKDNLIVFSSNKIDVLVGSSSSDFQFTSLTDKIGCISGDTPLEVGGDVLYLAPDGIRFLSDIDRSGDFGIDIASDKIKTESIKFINDHSSFQATLIRNKNQYRIFGYKENTLSKFNVGFCGTQFAGQGNNDIRWSQLEGFKVYSSTSLFTPTGELVVFSNETPYVYRMETGNTFDGVDIAWTYEAPWWALTDPLTRKTFYKVHLYQRLEGAYEGLLQVKIDFNDKTAIQPSTLLFGSDQGSFSIFGDVNAVFGVSVFGGSTRVLFPVQVVGNGGVFSLTISGDRVLSKFTLDNAFIEFGQKGRK